MDGAKAENDVAAGSWASKAQHGTEAREKKHLVELVTERDAVRARENLVVGHAAVGIDGDVEEQAVGQRKFEVTLVCIPGLGIVGKRDEFRRLHEVERNIVLDGANGDARRNHVKDHDENEDGGEESAGSRKCERTKNVVEQNFSAVFDAAQTAGPIVFVLSLGSGNFDAHSEVDGRNGLGNAGKQHG